MTNAKRNLSKYYIKQFIINDISFQDWCESNLETILENNKIIGYLFTVLESKLGQNPKVLNLYLIRKDYYEKPSIDIEILAKDWELFLLKCNDNKRAYNSVFRNPPIEQWLDTKDNWCKKLANEISTTFKLPYEEALSDVYLSIMKCYNKNTIYMGNLNYLRKTAYNVVLMTLRYNKKRLNLDNVLVCSLNTPIDTNKDGEELTLIDLLPADEEMTEDSLEYKDLLKRVTDLLSKSFSQREIDQILKLRNSYLPVSIYKRLLNWRTKHSVEEVL